MPSLPLRTAVCLIVASAPCLAAPQAPWTAEQMAADLEQITAAVKSDWSYCDDKSLHFGVDVDALLAAAKQELGHVRTADDFARIVRRFGASLQDGHAWTFVPGQAPAPARRLPFRLTDVAEGLCVVVVPEGAEVPVRGDLLVAIEGTPVEERITALMRDEFGSTPGMRRANALEELHRTGAAKVRCTFADGNGERTEVELATLADDALPPARADAANWTLTWPRPGVALLRLSSFAVPRWEEWRQAKPEDRNPFLAEGRAAIDAIIDTLRERQATALIIDVRDNGGGTDLLGIHLADRLLEREFRYTQLSAKGEDGWRRPGGLTYGKGNHARFTGKVIALVDDGSFSTTDNFLRCLDDLHPQFTVVGRPSGGGTGAPRQLVETAHSKAVLGACTMRVYGPMGELIEGRGTEPDVAVVWTRADWLAARDPDLEAALPIAERDSGPEGGK